MSGLLRAGEAATLVGVDPATLGRWADAGRVRVTRTPSGHRRFRETDIRQLAADYAATRQPKRPTRLLMLAHIGQAGGCTMKDLTAVLGVSQATTHHVFALAELGYVIRHPRRGRIVLLDITDAGRAALAEMQVSE